MIELKGLTKKYGSFTAVDSIDLSVPDGELFGFLGPNGAGKTTTLIMAGTRMPGGHPPVRYKFSPPLFTPSIAPIAFMLGGPHKIGRKQTMTVFDPTTRAVIRRELTIRAESLFTVVDSAALDNTGSWSPAHRDTVRAWHIEGAPHGLTAWVDAEGRVVTASAGSFSATRTAFEIAFKNPKDK